MPRVIFYGHDFTGAVSDVMRMYYENVRVDGSGVSGGDPGDDVVIRSAVENGTVCTSWEIGGTPRAISGPPEDGNIKREIKRQMYRAISEITGISFPWGSLSGIRPTLVAKECLDRPEKLRDLYYVSEEKVSLAMETCRREEAVHAKLPADLMHCYVGIPFCRSRCSYCSFVSQEYRRLEKYVPAYVETLLREAAAFLPRIENRMQSLYIGGGTPTSLPDELFEKLLREISGHLAGEHFTEYTIEAGRADSITQKKCELMKRYGAKRICINPQTMNDATLRRIGRAHTAAQVREAFSLARKEGFEAINMDLIAGLPGERFPDFKESLDELIAMAPENITVHTLSLKRTSELTKCVRGDAEKRDNSLRLQNFHQPDEEISGMIEYSVGALRQAGYHPYYLYRQKDTAGGHENVGYAKAGQECLYNVAMMGDRNSVLALGAGGMSKRAFPCGDAYRIERLPNLKDIESYLKRIDEMIEKKQAFFSLNKRSD